MKRLGIAALQLMLTSGNKVFSCQDACRRVGDVFLMNESSIGGRDVRFFGVKNKTTQITPRWGYLSIP